MCVTEKLAADDVSESQNDFIVFPIPCMHAAGRVRRYMAEDMDELAFALGMQQSVVEPLELLVHLVAAIKVPSAAEEAKSNRKTEAQAVKSSHIKREAEIIVENDGA